jgi:cell wall assembly regulator SMI1
MLRIITDSHPPIGGAELQQLQAGLGRPLPEDYQRFLLLHNGGRADPPAFALRWNDASLAKRFPKGLIHVMFCIDASSASDLMRNLASYRERIPADTLPIGMDPGGNILLLGLAPPHTGRVLFWVQDHEVAWEDGETPDFSNVGLAAQSFNEFLQLLDEP